MPRVFALLALLLAGCAFEAPDDAASQPEEPVAQIPASDAWGGGRDVPRCGAVIDEHFELIEWLCAPEHLIDMGDDFDPTLQSGALEADPTEPANPLSPK